MYKKTLSLLAWKPQEGNEEQFYNLHELQVHLWLCEETRRVEVGGIGLNWFAVFELMFQCVWAARSLSLHRIDRKKDKAERKILDSQERAFWDVHRPVVSQEHTHEK